MPRLFAGQRTPRNDNNFFQNYRDHLICLGKNLVNKSEIFAALPESQKDHWIIDELLKQLTMFDAMRDMHDYADEVVGATIVPFVGACFGTACLFGAIYLGVNALLSDQNNNHHGRDALIMLGLAAASLTIAFASFVKSSIGLIGRPISTYVNGWKPQDEVRFVDGNSVEARLSDELLKMGRDIQSALFNHP